MTDLPEASKALREAIVFERHEKDHALFEAQQIAQERIDAAHRKTIEAVRLARDAGVTKTSIANHMGVKNMYRVNQLLKEAGIE